MPAAPRRLKFFRGAMESNALAEWAALASSTAPVLALKSRGNSTLMHPHAPTTFRQAAAAAAAHCNQLSSHQVVATGFVFDGATYLSCEHAFQAAKFFKQSHTRTTLEQMQPLPGESDEAFGNRCWGAGQGLEDRRADWESAKVKVMLAVNRAKYAQHMSLRYDLLNTLPAPLHGNPYTTSWTRGGQQHSWCVLIAPRRCTAR
jgi:predicted NAD-dependent protein-ADP-ribosyltransferase YbiA (DUF1768 family)